VQLVEDWQLHQRKAANFRIPMFQCLALGGNKASCPREQWDTMAIIAYWCILCHMIIVIYSVI
jgi:hypothetical protein